MSTSLPPELWFRIADFLPDTMLAKAASVNRTFLDAATERIFRHLVFDSDKHTAINATLDCIEFNADIARRIRSLTIHTRPLRSACLQAERFTTTRPLLTRILHLLAIMPSLTALSIITPVAVESHSEQTFVLKLLPHLFNTIPATLTLAMPITTLLAHLAGHGRPVVPLSRLKKLSLRLSLPPASEPFSLTMLGSFIASCNSLTHLELEFNIESICTQKDFSALFVLSRLPLSHLSLRMPLGAAHYDGTPQALKSFLEMHTPSLQSLIVEDRCLCSVTRTDNRRLHTLSFPVLRSLTLALNTKGLGDLRIPPFLGQVAETVAKSSGTQSSSGLELCIEGCIRNAGELSSLVAPFAVSGEQTHIESLVIEVQHLSVALFQLLSSLLPGPRLRALEVCYHAIEQGQDDGLIDSLERATYFASAMRGVSLPWASLKLVLRDMREKDGDEACRRCWTAVAQCLV